MLVTCTAKMREHVCTREIETVGSDVNLETCFTLPTRSKNEMTPACSYSRLRVRASCHYSTTHYCPVFVYAGGSGAFAEIRLFCERQCHQEKVRTRGLQDCTVPSSTCLSRIQRHGAGSACPQGCCRTIDLSSFLQWHSAAFITRLRYDMFVRDA